MADSTPTIDGSVRLPWLLRRDLEVFPADEGDSLWTIKDPVKLSYFRVESEELEVLRLLNGRRSWQEIHIVLSNRFPGIRFSERSWKGFLATAVRAGLLVPAGVGYGEHLAAEARQARASVVSRKMLSLISHRFRGIDPTALLSVLNHWLGWIFRPQILWLATFFVAVAAIFVLARGTQFLAELPTISQLLTSQNVILLSITIVVVKLLHEIGHGLTCYHYGGECHELGCIMIGFLPLLYCDVSDSWLQRNRGYRMQVAAAGIAVELFLAAIFGFLWMASVPGLLHSFFLNVMLVCSLNTVLVNGNPLLRYDGYYVLSDLLRIPNLGPESRSAALSIFDRVVLGLQRPPTTTTTAFRSLWMPIFGTASMVYRLVVTATILLFIHSALKAWRLESVTPILVFSVAIGLAMSVVLFARQRMQAVSSSGRVSRRALVGFGIFVAVVSAVLLVPLPHSIDVACTLTPGVSAPVFVTAAGSVDSRVQPGQSVIPGDVLAELTNPELLLELEAVAGEVRVRQARLQHLTSTRSSAHSGASASAIPAAEQAVASAQARLQTLQQKVSRLVLRSPVEGVVYPARQRPAEAASALRQTFWTGTALDVENRTAWLTEQTLLCWVGQTDQLRVMAYVPQDQIEFVSNNATVAVKFHSLPAVPIPGSIATVSSSPEAVGPTELITTGQLATTDAQGSLAATMYAAHVQLDSQNSAILPPLYATGTARITCEPRSLLSRGWRLLSHTFAFEI
ncbi:MAG: HlyD family efflux transporter periplasmic adaptor subunit [Planctomycetaceae bacterium]